VGSPNSNLLRSKKTSSASVVSTLCLSQFLDIFPLSQANILADCRLIIDDNVSDFIYICQVEGDIMQICKVQNSRDIQSISIIRRNITRSSARSGEIMCIILTP